MSLKYYFYNFFGYNFKIFQYINSFANNLWVKKTSLILSYVFSFQTIILAIIISCIIISIYCYLKKEKDNYVLRIKTFAVIILDYVCAIALLTSCKYLFGFIRPLCELDKSFFILPYPEISKICNHSFPSAHSCFATLLALNLWPRANATFRIFLIFLILATGVSRIILAMHYPSDVLYGILCAILIHSLVMKKTLK